MTAFTPYAALLGGFLIGTSAVLLLFSIGRVAGISGIVFGLLPGGTNDRGWRLAFLAGLLLGTLLAFPIPGLSFELRKGFPLWALLAGGFLVGSGTRLGDGCTSGHGVCGLGRRSPRSLAATVTFLLVAIATVFGTRHLLGVLS
jgi:uncharacterized membrane protein YedE/YeeE